MRAQIAVVAAALLPLCLLRLASGQDTQFTGRISGHVYRADTGEPLQNTFVILSNYTEKVRVERTAADGRYSFAGLNVASAYCMAFYHKGFVRYVDCPQDGMIGFLLRGAARAVTQSDLERPDVRLTASVEVVQMYDAPLGGGYVEESAFSAGGRYFVFRAGGIWLYDRRSQLLTSIAESGVIGRVADTLYAGNTGSWVAVTADGVKAIPDVPPEALTAMRNLEVIAGDFRFGVERPCHGCSWQLWVRKEGGEKRTVGDTYGGTVADPAQPVLFYGSQNPRGPVIELDLRSNRPREVALPNTIDVQLLGATRQADGFVLAYSALESCSPEVNPAGPSRWMIPLISQSDGPPTAVVRRICFAVIPDE